MMNIRSRVAVLSFVGLLTVFVGRSSPAQRLPTAPITTSVGTVLKLPRLIGGGRTEWSVSNPNVLALGGGTVTAIAPGTAWLRASYGNFRDSVQVTVVAPVIAAVTNVAPVLGRLSYDTLGIDVTWGAATNATSYQWRAYYLPDSVATVRTSVGLTSAALKLPRRVRQTYAVCVRGASPWTTGPEACVQQTVADIDSLKLWRDSAQSNFAIGSQIRVCAFAWYKGRVMQGQPAQIYVTLPGSLTPDSSVMKYSATGMTDAQCIALRGLPPSQVWSIP